MAEIPSTLKNLRNRAIIPIRKPAQQAQPAHTQQKPFPAAQTQRFNVPDDLPDPANVQGDVYILFSKVLHEMQCFLHLIGE